MHRSPGRGGRGAAATAPRGFVPYRNSVLTRLLKESLGGNSRTVRGHARAYSGLRFDCVRLLTGGGRVAGGHTATGDTRQGLEPWLLSGCLRHAAAGMKGSKWGSFYCPDVPTCFSFPFLHPAGDAGVC